MICIKKSILLSEFFRIFCKLQRFYQFINITIEHCIEIIKSKAYPMIGNTALGKIIGSYFSTPVASTYQTFPVAGNFFLLFSYLFFIQPCAEHLHGLLPVA